MVGLRSFGIANIAVRLRHTPQRGSGMCNAEGGAWGRESIGIGRRPSLSLPKFGILGEVVGGIDQDVARLRQSSLFPPSFRQLASPMLWIAGERLH